MRPGVEQGPGGRVRRWLRLLVCLLVCWLALGVFLAGGNDMSRHYRLTTAQGLLAGLVQGVAVVLALRWPGRAWALSLGGTVVTALAVRETLPPVQPGPNYPWSTPEVLAHAAVFLLLALRRTTRTTVATLAATGLATAIMTGLNGGGQYSSTGTTAVSVFAVAVLVGIAFRGRAEARTQLVEQETITAEERARRTLLEERSRIARELHDVVAHHMSVISIQAQVAPHLVQDPPEELKENLAGIRQNALEALTELRRVLGVLRSEHPDAPQPLDGPGTGAAPDAPQPTLDRLDALVENTRAAGLTVTLDVTGERRPLPSGVELSAYRIVQEALSNVLRHAPGATARVQVEHHTFGLSMMVVNSRPTRAAPPSSGAGHGLLGMRERVAMLGGGLWAGPEPDGGYQVSAFLPAHVRDDGPAADTGRPTAGTGLPAADTGLSASDTGLPAPASDPAAAPATDPKDDTA
ncbi:sensor histidine kinase [Streptomyces sp. S.PNR 29]|uniref:sensor histidine kinase n=1 Tax=Streptomyces sp. S.PNR 29 TaxID=2973805 RepID=UPI0025B031A3|nr:sensor histidine kinase [Streptomyces sp. S.PNR 29]MDN0198245.1 sensor histidine kinase [Streptomyces sp. S.PNR 29]